MPFFWEFINNSKNCIHVFWFRQIYNEITEEILSMFLKDFKRVQQICRPLSESFSTFAYHAVEDVIINIIIQSRSVIIKLNLTPYSVSSLMTIKWLIMGESKKLSNHTFRNSEMMIFVKNWILNHYSLWNSITPFFWPLHTPPLDLLQLPVNLVYLFNPFIEITLTRGALLHTFPPF